MGPRSAERMAIHLLVGRPDDLPNLASALEEASRAVRRCARCGNMSESELCGLCADERRDARLVCVVEHVADLVALERSGSWRGGFHVLHGRLSPIHGIGPGELNIAGLVARAESGGVDEVVLALSNDVEGEATCHYLTERLGVLPGVRVTRIGFGLPSGGGVLYADAVTLRSAMDGRRQFQ